MMGYCIGGSCILMRCSYSLHLVAQDSLALIGNVCKISLSFRLSFSLSDMTNYESADF